MRSWRETLGDPMYRVFFAVLLVQGFASGAAVPFVALWAANVLGADAVEIGVLRTVSGIVGVAFGLLLGAVTDRTRRRAPWIVGGMAAVCVAWFGMAHVRDLYLGAVLYALASVGSFTIVFALLGDWLRYRETENATGVHSTVRLSFAIGWLAGPAVAGFVVDAFGYTPLFVGAGAIQAVATVMAAFWMRDPPVVPARSLTPSAGGAPPTARLAFWLVIVATFFTYAASPSRFVLLPLYITEQLGAPVAMVGLLFTVSVAFELPMFPTVVALSHRFGTGRVIAAGFLVHALYFVGLAGSSQYWQLLALELLFAFLVATTNGIGMLYVQEMVPARAGTAIALYNASFQLGPVAAAPLLAYLETRAGWASAFLASAAFALMGVGAFVLSLRAGSSAKVRTPSPSPHTR